MYNRNMNREGQYTNRVSTKILRDHAGKSMKREEKRKTKKRNSYGI